MGRPEGVIKSKIKDNSNKHPQQHAEWMEGKKIGRKKQAWVLDKPKGTFVGTGTVSADQGYLGRGTDLGGHWEKQ